ncbi:Aste57867_8774 [Aphanomyces stellatus]|uniref:Aste57867_8774 protein n=1 Tax=Aphanomyces stellatus TaxID=120398 RepID=A0A485KL66_9STRA|nr:hypothetical protein As57867_008740 [Aphanomyces stellatus]VFT85660.1 Aste57867_8774 [Aphanomyces stellatus]
MLDYKHLADRVDLLMEKEERQHAELASAQAHAKWKQLHLQAQEDRVAFAKKLQERYRSLVRCCSNKSANNAAESDSHGIEDDLLQAAPPLSACRHEEGDDAVGFHREWAANERFNIDEAHMLQMVKIENDWRDYHAHVDADVAVQMVAAEGRPVPKKKQEMVRALHEKARQLGELRKMDATRMLRRQHVRLHVQIDAKELEYKLVVLVKEQETRERRRLDSWITVFLYVSSSFVTVG